MIIDSFVFNNELDVLEIRLAELYDTIDFFILIEASKTQTRLDKPYFYLQNKERFNQWNDKIISLQLEDYIPGGMADWSMENFQRQQILTGLDKLQAEKKIKLSMEDYLLISDLDEIPMTSKLKEIIEMKPDEPLSINCYFISYYANLYCSSRGWWGSVLTPLKYIQEGNSPQYLRNKKDTMNHIGIYDKWFYGWHLSALGGFNTVFDKALHNIEPHEKTMLLLPNSKETYREIFNQHVLKEKYFLFLDNPSNKSIKLE
ncbi:MAG: hypothetical protein AABY22_35370, partial [Nanoarchaeota archaeon]